MICNVCRHPQCKCGQRTLARFLLGAVLVVVSAVGVQWVWESRPATSCETVISSQGVCLDGPRIQNGASK